MLIFSEYKSSGFDIKWVDDTHCLVIFSNAKIGESWSLTCEVELTAILFWQLPMR
jgi:hypothetical protein